MSKKIELIEKERMLHVQPLNIASAQLKIQLIVEITRFGNPTNVLNGLNAYWCAQVILIRLCMKASLFCHNIIQIQRPNV